MIRYLPAVLAFSVLAWVVPASAQTERPHALRYDTDGTLDTSGFGNLGEVILTVPGATAALTNNVAIQSDGKILVAGSVRINGEYRFMVGRLNANGTPDTSFSQDGFAFLNETDLGAAYAITSFKQKIVAVGSKWSYTDESIITVARFNRTDGSLDATFGTAGVAEIAYAGHRAYAHSVKIMPLSERVLVGGNILETATFDREMMVARLNYNGTPDTTFNTDGKQEIAFNGYASAWSSGMDIYVGKTEASGYIAIGGTVDTSGGSRCGVAVLTPTGARLNSFDGDGRKIIEFPYGASQRCGALKMFFGDRIVIAGDAYTAANGGRFIFTKLKIDGSLDTGFDGDGYRAVDVPGYNNETLTGLAVDSSSTVIVGVGTASAPGSHDTVTAIAHMRFDGLPTALFSGDGVATYDAPAFRINRGNGIALEDDGQVVIVGELDGQM
jgi:uncharacterized delta-60 repeat protein